MKTDFITGNIAIAEAAITAGLKLFAGYPISPSSEILEYLAEKLPKYGGIVIQTEDEIAAINTIIGASWAGSKSMTATSGPGLSLMAESIGLAVMTETPVVIVDVMRAGPSTGVATKVGQGDVMQARWLSHGSYELVVLAPWSAQECFDMTIEAFNIAERLRIPVILLSDATIGHTRERVVIKEPHEISIVNRKKPKSVEQFRNPFKPEEDLVPPMVFLGEGHGILVESLTHDERGYYKPETSVHAQLVRRLIEKVKVNEHIIINSSSYYVDDVEIMFISFGSTARSVYGLVRNLRKRGIKAGLFRPKSLWPLDKENLIKACKKAKKVFVIENNAGQLVYEVERILKRNNIISIPLISLETPSPEEIWEVVREWF